MSNDAKAQMLDEYKSFLDDVCVAFDPDVSRWDFSRTAFRTTLFYMSQGFADLLGYLEKGDIDGGRDFIAAWRKAYEMELGEIDANVRKMNAVKDAIGSEGATVGEVREAFRLAGVDPGLGEMLFYDDTFANMIASARGASGGEEKAKKHYDAPKTAIREELDRWRADPTLYSKKENFDTAMSRHTGYADRTVAKWRRDIERSQVQSTP